MIQVEDIKFFHSEKRTDTGINGGRAGDAVVADDIKYNILPRVLKEEREQGITRYRKVFLANMNANNESVFELFVNLITQTNGDDFVMIEKGTQTDTQGDLEAEKNIVAFFGCGRLAQNVTAGDDTIVVNMESDEHYLAAGDYLFITSNIKTGQTVNADVDVGDYVQYSDVDKKWVKIAKPASLIYPYGKYLGNGEVYTTYNDAEFVKTVKNTYTETIGVGNGTGYQIALSDLTHIKNGLDLSRQNRPVITTKDNNGNTMTAYIDKNGECYGDCMTGIGKITEQGVWETSIEWNNPVGNGEEIKITYTDKCFTKSGNQYTIYLQEKPIHDYDATHTNVAKAILIDELKGYAKDYSVSSAGGNFDYNSYPVVVYNEGGVYDEWTIHFISDTQYTLNGIREGNVGTGNINEDFEPVNNKVGKPYMKIQKNAFAGTWSSGDEIVFVTIPARLPIWIKEVVPKGAQAIKTNMFILGWQGQ